MKECDHDSVEYDIVRKKRTKHEIQGMVERIRIDRLPGS